MKNLIKTLKSTTLGDAIAPIKDKSMLQVVLSFTGVCSMLQMYTALLAKIVGDDEIADRNLTGAFLNLLINLLLTVYSAEPELPAAAAAAEDDSTDDGTDNDVSVEISLDDSEEA